MTAVEDHPRRVDAVRNRVRVVAAAAEAFAERGLGVRCRRSRRVPASARADGLPLVPDQGAPRRGGGRRAPRRLRGRVRAALTAPDERGSRSVTMLSDQAAGLARDRALVGGMTRRIRLPEVEAARASVWSALGALVARGQASRARSGRTHAEDLRVLWAGACRVLADRAGGRPRRVAALCRARSSPRCARTGRRCRG